jgi:hypothetical protein
MRTALSGLVLLLAVVSLVAQEPAPTLRPPPTDPDQATAQRRMADLNARLVDLQAKAAAIRAAKDEQSAEYKVKLATLEAEHKTRLANLDRDHQRVSSAAEAVNMELVRLANETRAQQDREGGRGRFGEPRPRRAADGAGQPIPPPGLGDANAKPTVEQKLDQMMKKLEEMDQRMKRLEARTRNQQ